MNQRALAPLSERIIGYPVAAPQSMADLLATDYGFLKNLEATPDEIAVVLEFRREALDTLRSMEQVAITSPEIALRELTNRRIRPLAKRWLVLALDKDRKRRFVPKINEPGAMAYASTWSNDVPSPAHLAEHLPLSEGGRYLVIHGHSPAVLSREGAPEAVSRLLFGAPVADVLFWHLVAGAPPTLFSLRKGQGDQGGKPVSFPDPAALAIARSSATAGLSGPTPQVTETAPPGPDEHRRQ